MQVRKGFENNCFWKSLIFEEKVIIYLKKKLISSPNYIDKSDGFELEVKNFFDFLIKEKMSI